MLNIEAFCAEAKHIVQAFIEDCTERKLPPSYKNFTLWINISRNFIGVEL